MIKHPLRSGNGNEPPPPAPDAAPGQTPETDAEPAADAATEDESDKK